MLKKKNYIARARLSKTNPIWARRFLIGCHYPEVLFARISRDGRCLVIVLANYYFTALVFLGAQTARASHSKITSQRKACTDGQVFIFSPHQEKYFKSW